MIDISINMFACFIVVFCYAHAVCKGPGDPIKRNILRICIIICLLVSASRKSQLYVCSLRTTAKNQPSRKIQESIK